MRPVIIALLASIGCSAPGPTVLDPRSVSAAGLPGTAAVSVACPTEVASLAPAPSNLAHALALVWDEHLGLRAVPRPVLSWSTACDDDGWQCGQAFYEVGTDGTALVPWRGSLACSDGFLRSLFVLSEWRRGSSFEAAVDDERRLGSRSEELMRLILISNGL